MNPFNRLPASKRAVPGLEWRVLKRLGTVLWSGTLACIGLILLLKSGWLAMPPKASLETQYTIIGFILFHWMGVLLLALVCGIVTVMKGHAYVMDAYPLPDSDCPDHPHACPLNR